MTWNWTTETTMGTMMDTVDYNPDILEREVNAREQMTTRQEMPPSSPKPQRAAPEIEAMGQTIMDLTSQLIAVRARLIEATRLLQDEADKP